MGYAFDVVLEQARGERRDYRLEHRPLSREGGQGDVFRGVHKGTGTEIALKKLRSRSSEAVARMRREIEVGSALRTSPNVMPVLDAAADHTWFVMPLAEGNAQEFASELRQSQESLREMVEAVAMALAAAHEVDWVHRDVKPANILRIDRGGKRSGCWRTGASAGDHEARRRDQAERESAFPTGLRDSLLQSFHPMLMRRPRLRTSTASDK